MLQIDEFVIQPSFQFISRTLLDLLEVRGETMPISKVYLATMTLKIHGCRHLNFIEGANGNLCVFFPS